MTKPGAKLSLQEVTNIGREVVREDEHEVIGTVPAEGASDYAELIVALHGEQGSSTRRLSIGVHRAESADCVRAEITRQVRTGG